MRGIIMAGLEKMRITGGTAKGHPLKTPKSAAVRPTTDRVREAIFSILSSLGADWSRCLDLFAGSGALGIEALSRNSTWVDFVDREPECCAIIRDNLTRTGFLQKAHVYCCSVSKALSFLASRYDVVFLDPPYTDKSAEDVIRQIAVSKLIDSNSVVVISHASRNRLQEKYDGLSLLKEKRYGDTCISIFHKEVTS